MTARVLSLRPLAAIRLSLAAAAVAVLAAACAAPAAAPLAPAPGQKAAVPSPEVKEHEATGFPLRGRHAEIDCDACHGKTEPKPACAGCHPSPHDPNLRRACEDCHTAGLPFAQVKFHHPGKSPWTVHPGTACRSCHSDLLFGNKSRACGACHADYHKGSLDRSCDVCHRGPAWTVNRFNHNSVGFPLMGTHRALECGDCHRDRQAFRIAPRPTGCASCHEGAFLSAPFDHAGHGAGRECQECHLQDSWSYAHSPFWFNIQTGRHAGISCGTCHTTAGNYLEYTCHQCHEGHPGDRNGRCLDCHPGGFPDRAAPAAPGGPR